MTKTIKRLLPAALAVLLAGCAMQPVDSTTTRYRVALVAKTIGIPSLGRRLYRGRGRRHGI